MLTKTEGELAKANTEEIPSTAAGTDSTTTLAKYVQQLPDLQEEFGLLQTRQKLGNSTETIQTLAFEKQAEQLPAEIWKELYKKLGWTHELHTDDVINTMAELPEQGVPYSIDDNYFTAAQPFWDCDTDKITRFYCKPSWNYRVDNSRSIFKMGTEIAKLMRATRKPSKGETKNGGKRKLKEIDTVQQLPGPKTQKTENQSTTQKKATQENSKGEE